MANIMLLKNQEIGSKENLIGLLYHLNIIDLLAFDFDLTWLRV